MSELKKIGKGSCGDIYQLGDNAIKDFGNDDMYFHYEVLINSLLPDSKHLVKCRNSDFKKNTFEMDLYDMNLEKYILDDNKEIYTSEGIKERESIIKDIFE